MSIEELKNLKDPLFRIAVWFIVFASLMIFSFYLVSLPNYLLNVLGILLLIFIVLLSIATKLFTDFSIKNKHD